MMSPADLLRIRDESELESQARDLVASGRDGEATVLAAFSKARGTKPFCLVRALASSAPGGEAEKFLLSLVESSRDLKTLALHSLALIQGEAATPMLSEVVASHPSSEMRLTALRSLAVVGDRRGRHAVFDYLSRSLTRRNRRDSIPPLVSFTCLYLLHTADGVEEVEQIARLLAKRRANLTPLDLRWISEYWPGEWLTMDGADIPEPDVDRMRMFDEDPTLQRPYLNLY